MTPRHTPPLVDANLENPEDESRIYKMSADAERDTVMTSRRQENRYDPAVILARTSSERQKDKPRRSHRNAPTSSSGSNNNNSNNSSSVSRSSNRSKARISNGRYQMSSLRDEYYGGTRQRQRHTRAHPRGDSSSSSSGEEEAAQDHREVLAVARASLTSPSLISNLTSLTTATNNSGSSSGSNSTVTQSSLLLSQSLVPKEVTEPNGEVPISPAVPDPPDVFSFLEQDSPDEDEDDLVDEDSTPQAEAEPQWLSDGIYDSSPLPHHVSLPHHESMSSSSASSSFHSDEGSEPTADNDTDRSTSPERSVKGEDDTAQPDHPARTNPVASKLASQMLAAQHRQSMHGAYQTFGSPQMAREVAALPHLQSKALSPRQPPHMQQPGAPRAEQIPITGYEAIASKLSNHSSKSSSIKPIYRKFERLNHRLLLHLQDELAELEEQLNILDSVDTQSRSSVDASGTEIHVYPASRRAGAHVGGELEWRKMDLTNKIAYKLAQYNQALTSFNKLTQELDLPDLEAVKKYRHFLHNEKPVIENETKFLDSTGDLVVLGCKSLRVGETERLELKQPRKVRFEGETSQHASRTSPQLRIIAAAVAAAVLIPILTFAVIPGFLGRMTVVMLVATFLSCAMFQSGVAGRTLLGNMEWASCAMIYAGVMVIVAAIFA